MDKWPRERISSRTCSWRQVMSLSYRNRGAVAAAAGVAGMLSAAGAADAAEIYYQPIVQVSTAYNTNVELENVDQQSAEGYYADAATLIGIATPTSETTIEPRLLYNYYPTIDGLNR